MKWNFILFLVLSLQLFSCKQSDQNHSLAIFKYNQASGITSLDPAFAKNQANIWAVSQLFNGLVQLDQNLQIQPCIAKSWDVSNAGKTFTFHLREDVFFHENELFEEEQSRRVKAQDFVYSFQRIIDPKVASSGAWIFNGIIDTIAPFKAIDDTTFQVNLSKPFRPVLGILAMPYCFVVPEEVVGFYGKDFRSHPIGTGAFQLKIWDEGTALVALKNNAYFETYNGEPLPHLDGFKLTFSDNKKMEFLNFRKGKLDMVSGVDKSSLAELFDANSNLLPEIAETIQLNRAPFLNTEYLGINYNLSAENPLSQREIRQAINYCFDREAMINYLRKGVGSPANAGFVPVGLPSFNAQEVNGYSYNPQRAAELLKEANYKGEEINLQTNENYKDIALFIANQAKDIGLQIKVEVVQPSILREWMSQGTATFFRGSWIADYPDAENYLALFYSKNGAPPNYTGFANATFDALYESSLSENNDSLRYSMYQEMDKIILEEAPVIVLYYDEVMRFTQKNISGATPNALNLLDLKYIKKEI